MRTSIVHSHEKGNSLETATVPYRALSLVLSGRSDWKKSARLTLRKSEKGPIHWNLYKTGETYIQLLIHSFHCRVSNNQQDSFKPQCFLSSHIHDFFLSQWKLGLKIVACTWAVTSTWSPLPALELIALILHSLRHAFLGWIFWMLNVQKKTSSVAIYFGQCLIQENTAVYFRLGPWLPRGSIPFVRAVTISNPNFYQRWILPYNKFTDQIYLYALRI
jgi:hypothetical protein